MAVPASFVRLFQPEIDWDGIEDARGRVRDDDIAALVDFYQAQREWPRKLAVVQLVQDRLHPALEPVMLDVLRAPKTQTWLDDTIELCQAVALGHLSGTHERFMHYYNDRVALRADVEAQLAARGLSVARPPAPSATRP